MWLNCNSVAAWRPKKLLVQPFPPMLFHAAAAVSSCPHPAYSISCIRCFPALEIANLVQQLPPPLALPSRCCAAPLLLRCLRGGA